MRIFSLFLFPFLLLLPSCFSHKHSRQGIPVSTTAITVTVTVENLTEDQTISTHNDEIFCAVFLTSHDSMTNVTLIGYDLFTMDSVGQEKSFVTPPTLQPITGALSVVLIEMDSDSTEAQISQLVKQYYYTLAHALTVNDQQAIHRIMGDDDLLGMHVFPGEYLSYGGSLWYDIYGMQSFNHYAFTVEVSTPKPVRLP